MKATIVIIAAICQQAAAALLYCDNNCQPVGSTHGGYFCIEGKPSGYTRCSNGVRSSFDCPTGLLWDQPNLRCDWPSAVKFTCKCAAQPATTTTTTVKTTTKTVVTTTAAATTTARPTTMATTTPYNPSSIKRVCYFTNWAQYRPKPAAFKPNDVDPNLCSHIMYAFLKATTAGITFVEWNDDVMIAELVALKAINKNLKILASVGGWSAGTLDFQKIVASNSSMKAFNQEAIKFLRRYNFDGLDVDYEYPASAEKTKFATWMQMLAADFQAENAANRLILSAAVAGGKSHIDAGYDIPKLSAALDMINVMTYDFAGSWMTTTGHNSPLHAKKNWAADSTSAQNTVEFSIKHWIQKGAAAHKLLMGIPFYGRSFKLFSSKDTQVGAPVSGPGLSGTWTREAGFNSYYETCMMYKCPKPMYTYVYDREMEAPYMYNSAGNWVATEDTESIKAKVKFAQAQRLAGVFFWSLDLDDFGDMCDNGVRFPLLKTVNNVIQGRLPPILAHNATGDSEICGATIA